MYLNAVQGDGISLCTEGRYQEFTGRVKSAEGLHGWLTMLFPPLRIR